jgi:hypothetical protein
MTVMTAGVGILEQNPIGDHTGISGPPAFRPAPKMLCVGPSLRFARIRDAPDVRRGSAHEWRGSGGRPPREPRGSKGRVEANRQSFRTVQSCIGHCRDLRDGQNRNPTAMSISSLDPDS